MDFDSYEPYENDLETLGNNEGWEDGQADMRSAAREQARAEGCPACGGEGVNDPDGCDVCGAYPDNSCEECGGFDCHWAGCSLDPEGDEDTGESDVCGECGALDGLHWDGCGAGGTIN